MCNRKLRFHYIKKLREDRTAADKKYVAYCDPPQAENLASEILFILIKRQLRFYHYKKAVFIDRIRVFHDV